MGLELAWGEWDEGGRRDLGLQAHRACRLGDADIELTIQIAGV